MSKCPLCPESRHSICALHALVQGRIGIALHLGGAVDGTQAMQLSASARDFTGAADKAGERGIIEREHRLSPYFPECLGAFVVHGRLPLQTKLNYACATR